MTKNELLELLGKRGNHILKHRNGNKYALDKSLSVKKDGEWLSGVSYTGLFTGELFCREVSDFSNFEHVETLSFTRI